MPFSNILAKLWAISLKSDNKIPTGRYFYEKICYRIKCCSYFLLLAHLKFLFDILNGYKLPKPIQVLLYNVGERYMKKVIFLRKWVNICIQFCDNNTHKSTMTKKSLFFVPNFMKKVITIIYNMCFALGMRILVYFFVLLDV